MTEIVYDMEAARREEAIYHTPAAVDRRRRIRQTLSPTSGETVLSLGPGPGFEPLELASLTDAESVIGVDQSRAMLELATPLREAGFEIEAIGPYTICNTSLEGTFAGHLMADVHRHSADTLDQQTADRWQDAIHARERAGASFFSLTGVLYHLSKPPLEV